MTALPLLLNSTVVASEWLRTITPLVQAGTQVGQTLPQDNTSWGTSGFVLVQNIGGNHGLYTPLERPIMQLSAYAVSPNGQKPLFNLANAIISHIVKASREYEAVDAVMRVLTPTVKGKTYPQARVLTCYPLHEERKVVNDLSQAGRYDIDFRFHWTRV